MEAAMALALLRKRYPVLEYFASIEGVQEESLVLLGGQLGAPARAMSAQCKAVMRRVRQFASNAEGKLKRSRKLYKFLHHQQHYLTQIIMNAQQLTGIDALEHRSLTELTELQLASNQIHELTPLETLECPALEEVDLSSNCIASLLPLNHCHWTFLSSLLLSQNRIVSVQNVSFSNFQSIKIVNLSDNFLTRVRHLRKELNGNLGRLRQLDLSNNFITDLHCLSECRFRQLALLNLANNCSPNIFQVEKICMVQEDMRRSLSHYEVRVSTDWTRDKIFLYGYRERSRHKLSVKVGVTVAGVNRETIQKGRRLIFD